MFVSAKDMGCSSLDEQKFVATSYYSGVVYPIFKVNAKFTIKFGRQQGQISRICLSFTHLNI